MGKRSDFIRKPRDFYPTPKEAVVPLIKHLPNKFSFIEPCAGDGRLCDHIKSLVPESICVLKSDIEPQREDINKQDALTLKNIKADYIVTNPPWDRTKASGFLLHSLIEHFSNIAPTWLLFDADWIHTKQSSELVNTKLQKIVSIGRVKWIENSSSTGKDNCCWYLFVNSDIKSPVIEFHGR
jgi:hypothetical protein